MKFYVKGARLAWSQSLFEAEAGQPDPQTGKIPTPKYKGIFIVEPTTLGFVGDANPEGAAGKAKGYAYGPFLPALSNGILTAAKDAFADKAPSILAQLKAQNRLILHLGAEKGEKPGYVGNHYFNASNATRPTVVTKAGVAVTAADGIIYGGCYVDGVFDLWAGPNYKKAPMVGISLLAVIFDRDGERLTGGLTAAADDFAAIPPAAGEKAAASGAGAASLF